MSKAVWLIAAAVIAQTALATPIANQPTAALIKPQYCESISIARREAPPLPSTRIGIMADRHEALTEALLGWQRTGIPLIAFDGQRFLPAGCSDDIGIYYSVPMLSKSLRISLSDAIDLFFADIVLVSAVLGAIGLFMVCRTPIGKILAITVVLLVSLFALKIGDVYTIQSSAVLGFVPWVLFFATKANHWSIVLFVFLSAAALGTADLIRSHAGTAVLIFMALVFAFQLQAKGYFKFLLATAAVLGLLIPLGYSRKLLVQRDTYLRDHGYTSVVGLGQHGFWHVVYLGLGYVNNDVVPGYRDEFAAAKVREMAPNVLYASPEYDDYLKHEVIHIVLQHPSLVLENIAAKMGVILCLIIFCANLGLLATFYYPKRWPTEVGFWSAIAFESMIGFVAIPAKAYLLGLIAFTVLYGLISVDEALEQGVLNRVLGSDSEAPIPTNGLTSRPSIDVSNALVK